LIRINWLAGKMAHNPTMNAWHAISRLVLTLAFSLTLWMGNDSMPAPAADSAHSGTSLHRVMDMTGLADRCSKEAENRKAASAPLCCKDAYCAHAAAISRDATGLEARPVSLPQPFEMTVWIGRPVPPETGPPKRLA
jgi:hypothetical protein